MRTKQEQTQLKGENMVTKKQLQLFDFIKEYVLQNGVAPTFDEMRDYLGLKSKSSIHRLVGALEQQHMLHRTPKLTRSISPEGMNALSPANDVVQIPLYGKIAAGLPIEAVANETETISVPSSMTGSGQYYALLVEGDSMINAGILNGDTVIIKRANQANDGDIVVALIDGYDVTLKRFRKRASSIALEPANPAYETRIFTTDRIEIQGILSGLMRSY